MGSVVSMGWGWENDFAEGRGVTVIRTETYSMIDASELRTSASDVFFLFSVGGYIGGIVIIGSPIGSPKESHPIGCNTLKLQSFLYLDKTSPIV